MVEASGTGKAGDAGAARPPVEEIRIAVEGAAALITLDRPRALNALNTAMREQLAQAFPRFARDPQVYCVVVRSASEKAFCAGGDVRELTAWAREDMAKARKALADEYSLNWLHECFSKPTISLIDGAVMGSGVGISLFGTHRVAGERYKFAMPETAIGLFPDVGVAHALARMPDGIGIYLGLTGRVIGRADALALGLATHCIPAAAFAQVTAALVDADPVDPLLDALHVDPGPGEIEPRRGVIARCFSAATVGEILSRLEMVGGSDREWALEVARELRTRSPLSLAVTLRHLQQARRATLRETLQVDYRLACRFLGDHDFQEGVRAVLVDKDGAPRWLPASIEEVSPAMVDAYFAVMDAGELALRTRSEMQEART